MGDQELVRMLLDAVDAHAPVADHAQLTQTFRQTLLCLGSETPDNLNCAEHIEYGTVPARVDRPRSAAALKLKGTNILVSDLAHVIEDLELPPAVRRYFPDLTDDQWSAATRVITMLLISLESPRST